MARTKIDYGIDLGTTNSAISLMENGDIRILKSDKYQKDTTPSCVHFNRKKAVFVGDDALNRYRYEVLRAFKALSSPDSDSADADINTFIEFKRTMGTDKGYESRHMNHTFSSEELSAQVIKYLRSHAKDETPGAALITVPAKFRQNQIDATQRAAELAGFQYCELLQEPIAASLAYGIDAECMDGFWLVFDFGGGTFDAALMKVDEGIMKVADTEGDNHLGGKNIDYAIVDHIFMPYLRENYAIEKLLSHEMGRSLLRDALKWFAEETKIVLSAKDSFEVYTDEPVGRDDNGRDMELDMTVTLEVYENAVLPVFQRAADISLKLLENNNLRGNDLKTVVLVGGPTLSGTLRNMLKEQISPRLDTRIDPMTAVARGAAIFASTRDMPLNLQQRDRGKIQLTLKFPETSVETEENMGIRIERNQTSGEIPRHIFAEVVRGDKAWSCGKVEIQNDAEVIPILLDSGKTNRFSIILTDEKGNVCPCEPSEFSIIQGLKTANPTLPFAMCIEALDTHSGKQRLQPLRGLEKNQSLPAKGKRVFRNQKEIQAGKSDDLVKIPIYEGQPGTKAANNNKVHEVLISGKDLPQSLPGDIDVEVSLEIDSSRRMRLTAYFPYIDETCEIDLPDNTSKNYDAELLEKEIRQAREAVSKLENKCPGDCKKSGDELNQLSELLKNAGNDQDAKTQVKERLNEVQKDLDKIGDQSEWLRAEEELGEALKKLAVTQQRYGDGKTLLLLNEYEKQAQDILRQKNLNLAKELTAEVRSLDFALVSQDIGLWISYIRKFDEQFDSYPWKDREAARQLINEARQMIAENPSKAKLQHAVKELSALLPQGNDETGVAEAGDDELLKTKV